MLGGLDVRPLIMKQVAGLIGFGKAQHGSSAAMCSFCCVDPCRSSLSSVQSKHP